MEQILRERNLWPEQGLRAECEGFKCPSGQVNCCSRRLLFNQPDFVNQKSQLEEYITSRGHICDFYPKYHCELNFIEQYWGAAKTQYRDMQRTSTIEAMEENVIQCLDSIPLNQIRRYANRSARFIHAYENGLSGAQAAWANRRYHGHRVLPPDMLKKALEAVPK
ncbi:hypothetical protein BJV78DRAFT_1144295 [Lactifluus subvellereus]|nr:hypothetical protein BJV78DRAFT_1144295 [Lactifluus subvellereus]